MANNHTPEMETAMETLAYQLVDMNIGGLEKCSDAVLVGVATSLLKAMNEIIAATPIAPGMRKAIYDSVAGAVLNGAQIVTK